MRRSIRPIVIATVLVVLLVGFTMTAAAAITDLQRSAYRTNATVKTNIAGVSRFAEAPKGFDPVAASDMDLAKYGFPPRPSDASALAHWEKAMKAAKTHWTGELKARPYGSGPMRHGQSLAAGKAAGLSDTVTYYGSSNWSGVASLKSLTKFNAKTSIDVVISEFVVPNSQPPSGACGTSLEDPNGYYVSSWNWIDGFNNGDVLQGGTDTYNACGGGYGGSAVGWVEWYPSFAELDQFVTTWGNDFLVETVALSATEGYVFIEDLTAGVYSGVYLTPTTTPYLVGSSAEWIVERPCCGETGNLLPLGNYILEWSSFDYAEDAKGSVYHAGSTSTSTAVIDMYDDTGTSQISYPIPEKSADFLDTFDDSIVSYSEGCASSGGCTE